MLNSATPVCTNVVARYTPARGCVFKGSCRVIRHLPVTFDQRHRVPMRVGEGRSGSADPESSTVAPVPALLAYAVAMAVLIVGPPLLGMPFAPYPLLRVGEILDLLTPVILIPLAWLAFRAVAPAPPSVRQSVLFVALAALVIEGQAMHLAANAIGHFVDAEADPGGDLARLTHDLDETLSHVIWHAALIGLAVLIAWRSWRAPAVVVAGWSMAGIGLAAFFYGATYFLMVVEGGTTALGIPAAILIGPVGGWLTRRGLSGRPGTAVFVVGSIIAVILFGVWAAMNGWTLPQFCDMGWC